MINSELFIIENCKTAEYKVQRSRFVAYAKPLTKEIDIKNFLNEIKIMHKDANHIPYAYIFGKNQEKVYYSDDGEPANSAGAQILNLLKSKNITNTIVAVVRYFGGIKLGIPGLIDAFRNATLLVLQDNIVKFVAKSQMIIDVDFLNLHNVLSFLKRNNVVYETKTFAEKYEIGFWVEENKLDVFKDYLSKWTQRVRIISDF